ncbi:hypothetical protein IEQ34_004137 [Dendrobium chrysotoxum]|uniref:Uncharacterized protein n=1 Tax=Dendrobium chrysotoxum TaxID=161865 RepID=A0AAV7HFJ1_DENCH|nr:hypothetical protein IEQ34_004137 [Dendrobium chrysotoxum]
MQPVFTGLNLSTYYAIQFSGYCPRGTNISDIGFCIDLGIPLLNYRMMDGALDYDVSISATPWSSSELEVPFKDLWFFFVPKVAWPYASVKGFPTLLISYDNIVKLVAPYQFTLAGKFLIQRPNLDTIHLFLGNLKLSGLFLIGLLDAKHIIIQLSNDS